MEEFDTDPFYYNFTDVMNTGKLVAFDIWNPYWCEGMKDTMFKPYDGFIKNTQIYYNQFDATMIQLKNKLENWVSVGGTVKAEKELEERGLTAAGVIAAQAETGKSVNGKSVSVGTDKAGGWSENSVTMTKDRMEFINYIGFYAYKGEGYVKDLWVEGYFGNSMAEEGISAALDIYEASEECNNSRSIMLISAVDGSIGHDVAERAKRLGVSVNVAYMGQIDDRDCIDLYNVVCETGGQFYFGVSTEQAREKIYNTWRNNEPYMESDSDGDGIPDIYETAGLYLQNGQVIYTDPLEADTDGDGINNEYANDEKYAKEADETPMVSSVRVTMLAGAEEGRYVPVVYDGDEYTEDMLVYRRYAGNSNYGGSQMWMFDDTEYYVGLKIQGDTDKLKEYILSLDNQEYVSFCYEQGGCGFEALTDYLMYLEYYNDETDTRINDVMAVDGDGNKYVPYRTYLANYSMTALNIPFVCKPRVTPFSYTVPSGIYDPVMLMQLNSKLNYWYDDSPNRRLAVSFCNTARENINYLIENQLKNNFPVILSAQKKRVLDG